MRFFKAFSYLFKMLFSGDFFDRVEKLNDGKMCEPSVVFSLLQREGRFVDFLMEELSEIPDARVGAVARTLQSGCRKTLKDYVRFEPIMSEGENSEVEIPKGFDPNSVRLSGKVSGEPPFKGILIHHGWRMSDLHFPQALASSLSVAPAEVEVK